GEGDPDRLLLHRAAPRLPPAERHGRQDRLRQDPADRAARVWNRLAGRELRQGASERQPGAAGRKGLQGEAAGEVTRQRVNAARLRQGYGEVRQIDPRRGGNDECWMPNEDIGALFGIQRRFYSCRTSWPRTAPVGFA